MKRMKPSHNEEEEESSLMMMMMMYLQLLADWCYIYEPTVTVIT